MSLAAASPRRERRRRWLRRFLLLGVLLAAAWCLLAYLSRLPPDTAKQPSHSQPALETRIGAGIAALPVVPGRSGVFGLAAPIDAFATRALLVRAADRSLDLQYYIWNGDMTGRLMMNEVLQAAERGVKVRLLLDDNGTSGIDGELAALDAHENIEVRLFNPFVLRGFKPVGYFVDFERLNRRMHNKSLTADGLATIVGGRNLGDRYFDGDEHVAFVDLDVLAVGKVAVDVDRQFDEYWNSPYAHTAASILGAAPPEATAKLAASLLATRDGAEAARYMAAVDRNEVIKALEAGTLEFDWVPVTLAYDPPAKAGGKASRTQLLVTQLTRMMGEPKRQLEVISPYFVPGERGVKSLCAIAARGAKLRIVTNSLAANDVVAVHSGYARWRPDLLRCGVRLYELKPGGEGPAPLKPGAWTRPGSSSASLHGKVFSLDRSRAFVGSFNLDPRSIALNTEMGLVIDSPLLAGKISDALDKRAAAGAYEVRLRKDGKGLEWIEHADGRELVYFDEPGASAARSWSAWLLAHLPIEHLL
jgi:putative cardiolipin synthase